MIAFVRRSLFFCFALMLGVCTLKAQETAEDFQAAYQNLGLRFAAALRAKNQAELSEISTEYRELQKKKAHHASALIGEFKSDFKHYFGLKVDGTNWERVALQQMQDEVSPSPSATARIALKKFFGGLDVLVGGSAIIGGAATVVAVIVGLVTDNEVAFKTTGLTIGIGGSLLLNLGTYGALIADERSRRPELIRRYYELFKLGFVSRAFWSPVEASGYPSPFRTLAQEDVRAILKAEAFYIEMLSSQKVNLDLLSYSPFKEIAKTRLQASLKSLIDQNTNEEQRKVLNSILDRLEQIEDILPSEVIAKMESLAFLNWKASEDPHLNLNDINNWFQNVRISGTQQGLVAGDALSALALQLISEDPELKKELEARAKEIGSYEFKISVSGLTDADKISDGLAKIVIKLGDQELAVEQCHSCRSGVKFEESVLKTKDVTVNTVRALLNACRPAQ
jgi:hypothetical protein